MRTLIVDDDADMRALVRAVIEAANHGLEVAGEAADGAEGVDRHGELEPDVMIVDERMPGVTGVDMVREMREKGIDTHVIFFSAYLSEDTRAAMSELGPCAIVPKDKFADLPACLWKCVA